MPIARETRSQLADNLAALMRREITLREYNARHAVLEEEAPDDPGAAYTNWVLVELDAEGKISVDEDAWHNMQRILAFLESDLEAKWEEADYGWAVSPRYTGVLAALMIVMAAAPCAIFGMTLACLIIAWVVTGLIGTLGHEFLSRKRRPRRWPDPLGELLQSHWVHYAPLLDRFDLPTYSQATHRLPPAALPKMPIWGWLTLSPFIALGSFCPGPLSLLLGFGRVKRAELVAISPCSAPDAACRIPVGDRS
jgi:hypothetical protein